MLTGVPPLMGECHCLASPGSRREIADGEVNNFFVEQAERIAGDGRPERSHVA
ncbi:MAG: hypothetical protein WCH35_07110 [Comamonadaceae bacterium]